MIPTDGERKMTDLVPGMATRFEQVAKLGFFRLKCGLQQLDIALYKFYKSIIDNSFYGYLTGLIGYLRRQQNLFKEIKTQVKTVANTRWESISKASILIALFR